MKLLTSSSGSNLFASEYLEQHPEADGVIFEVHSIELANSGKGYFLRCEGFAAWIFKNSKEAKTLIPLLEKWSSPKSKSGFMVVVQVSKDVPRTNCLIAVDDEQVATWVKSSLVEVFTPTKAS